MAGQKEEMTGGTLTIVFLSQWKWSHELNTSRCKNAQNRTPQCARKECLHVLVVCLAVQLNIILIIRRTQHTVTSLPFFTALIRLQSYRFSSLGPVFHAHSSCRQKVELLQWNVTLFLCSFRLRLG